MPTTCSYPAAADTDVKNSLVVNLYEFLTYNCGLPSFTGHDKPMSSALVQLEDRAVDSDLSDRLVMLFFSLT